MSRRIVLAPIFCLLLLTMASLTVSAQDQIGSSDLVVFSIGEHEADLYLDEDATYEWMICNTGGDSYFVETTSVNPDDSIFDDVVSPSNHFIRANATEDGCKLVSMTITAPSSGEETTTTIGLSFTATNLSSGEQNVLVLNTTNRLSGITSPEDPEGKLFVYFWPYENSLPAPLDNKWGAFIISFLIWLGTAGLIVLITNVTARRVAHTETQLDDLIVALMKGPIFYLIVVFSFEYTLRIIAPPSGIMTTVDSVFNLLAVILITWLAYRLFKDILVYYGKILSARTQTDMDDRLIPVISKVGGVMIIILGIIFVLQSFGYDITLFLAGMGFLGIVIGFAARDSLANFFGGIFLMLDRPFKRGDLILLDSGEVCEVAWIGLRSTKLYHLAKHQMITLPNKNLSEEKVTNITMPDRRFRTNVPIGVAYGSDLDHVKRVLFEIVEAHPNVLKGEGVKPAFRVTEFADSSINVKVLFWVDQVDNKWRVESELKEAIDKRFKEENIDIPFPQRVVYMHSEQKM